MITAQPDVHVMSTEARQSQTLRLGMQLAGRGLAAFGRRVQNVAPEWLSTQAMHPEKLGEHALW